jgi:hypothetical protein
MLRKWQVLGPGLGGTEKDKAATTSRLLASTAAIGAVIDGIVAILNGVMSMSWILGMMTLGAFLAVVAEIVDQALYQQTIPPGGNRNQAAAASVLTYLFIAVTISLAMGLFIFG